MDSIRERLEAVPVATGAYRAEAEALFRSTMWPGLGGQLGARPERVAMPDAARVVAARENTVEAIAETDDVLLTQYLEGEEPSSVRCPCGGPPWPGWGAGPVARRFATGAYSRF